MAMIDAASEHRFYQERRNWSVHQAAHVARISLLALESSVVAH